MCQFRKLSFSSECEVSNAGPKATQNHASDTLILSEPWRTTSTLMLFSERLHWLRRLTLERRCRHTFQRQNNCKNGCALSYKLKVRKIRCERCDTCRLSGQASSPTSRGRPMQLPWGLCIGLANTRQDAPSRCSRNQPQERTPSTHCSTRLSANPHSSAFNTWQ